MTYHPNCHCGANDWEEPDCDEPYLKCFACGALRLVTCTCDCGTCRHTPSGMAVCSACNLPLENQDRHARTPAPGEPRYPGDPESSSSDT